MNENLQITDLIEAVQQVFSLEDEFLTEALPTVLTSIEQNLTSSTMVENIDAIVKEAELEGTTLQELIAGLETAKNTLFEAFMSLKEQYTDSEMRLEALDMIYSLLENYFSLIAVRIATKDTANIAVELIHPNAEIPTYAHPGDQGADLYAAETIVLEPHTYGNVISTGIKVAIPEGWAISIRPRSGLSKNTTLRISNAPATIDQQYRGEIKVLMDNIGPNAVTINAGERIAQLLLERNYQMIFTQVENVPETTERGSGGFGSSGN